MATSLRGGFCSACADLFYPARDVCPRCGQALEQCDFSGKGDIYSYTVRPAQAGAVDVVALVHLAEGAYVTAHIRDIAPEAIFIGLPVEAVGDKGTLAFRPRASFVD